MNLEIYLDDLESRIEIDNEENVLKQWFDFTENRFQGNIFNPIRKKAVSANIEWSDIPLNKTLVDIDSMLYQQYRNCHHVQTNDFGTFMNVRANYGSSIIPLLFGVEPFIMDESLNTLPTSRPLSGGLDEAKKLLDKGVPDIYQGPAEQALEITKRFSEIGVKYPKIGKYVHQYHPDTQGPMDICELLIGSRIFLDMYDYPELIHDFLALITQTYIKYLKEWYKLVPNKNDWSVHWGSMFKGKIMLRDDSAMNLSPEMYAEFIFPYDQQLLNEFGGGGIHFCGRGDHFIEKMSSTVGFNILCMSQPEYNDMEVIFKNTADKGIKVVVKYNPEYLNRDLHGNVLSYHH